MATFMVLPDAGSSWCAKSASAPMAVSLIWIKRGGGPAAAQRAWRAGLMQIISAAIEENAPLAL
ncbi:MAG: hypothetical protein IPM30_10005 [Burkholderiales bacterium]|nr:hypothetical protein [Burkholderiales bacterium]